MTGIALLTPASHARADCAPPERLKFDIVRTIARDRLGFTQGLEVHSGKLYESTGRIDGTTQVNIISSPSGKVATLVERGNTVFGEGLTILNNEIFQLTWKDHQVFVYSLDGTLKRTMRNPRFGWGLSNDGRHLIFTDGGSSLFFADPKTFAIVKEIAVRSAGQGPVRAINELELVRGALYANIFQTRRILRIDPRTGCVGGLSDLSALWNAMDEPERARIGANPDYVLNGIAYDAQSGLFYLTGKRWRYIFVGRFTPLR